ncbi:hypothetical protein BV25DRAFT_1832940 [Artomyces pyxidatus]|uniref:Uncharacterized protein n=1 Tax=Artomyces pyxidatus TaxID=48021 RepID=A0ACB8SHF1_9AGAM|nr:hypothetical protein BV25DRAFT_1832940 [Artomyces pyxidatus]
MSTSTNRDGALYDNVSTISLLSLILSPPLHHVAPSPTVSLFGISPHVLASQKHPFCDRFEGRLIRLRVG